MYHGGEDDDVFNNRDNIVNDLHLRDIENGTLSVFPQNGGDRDHSTFT